MHRGDVSGDKDGDDRAGREDIGNGVPGAVDRGGVAVRRPRQEAGAHDEPRALIATDEGSVGQVGQGGRVDDFLATGIDALGLQDGIHLRRRGAAGATVGERPEGREFRRVCVPALEAGPVARGERGCLIEKEQLGILPRRHHHPLTPLEGKPTADPLPGDPAAAAQAAMLVMKSTAPVAHHEAPSRMGNDVAFGRYSVLERHGAICQACGECQFRREDKE